MTTPARAPEVTAVRPPFPYPGLRPFAPEEWSIFFGREAMIDDIITRLADHRFVLIHGASGSGKSSLVTAGVLPKLARQHLRYGAPWLTGTMRPSGGPLWNLAAEFARLEGRGGDVARITDIIRRFNGRGTTLSAVVNSLDGMAGKRLCLLVDQFEELFRFERETSREEVELFVELLIGAIPAEFRTLAEAEGELAAETEPDRHDGNLHIIITMRSEFLGECARFDRFAEVVNRVQYLVPRLTRAGLMRAIRQPARLYGGEVTAELADRLIADVRGRLDELPLIQHGLMSFWHERAQAQSEGKIVLDGAMLDRAGTLAQLLSDHADQVKDEAAPDEQRQKIVERLFRSLTDINVDGQAIRRPQSFRDLFAVCCASQRKTEPRKGWRRLIFFKKKWISEPVDQENSYALLRGIIDIFRAEGASFITPYAPAPIGETTIIDISHESLIRSWGAIADPQNGWLRREFEAGLVWRSLLLQIRDFEQNRWRVLSAATTKERSKWLVQQTKEWSERYGGNWDSVDRLLKASRKAGIRAARSRRLFISLLIPLAWGGLAIYLEHLFPGLGKLDWWNAAVGLSLIAWSVWPLTLIVFIILDLARDSLLHVLQLFQRK